MDRRRAIFALAALSALPSPAKGQSAKTRRIGILEPADAEARAKFIDVFRRRLADLGYREGREISLDMRFAKGNLDSLPGLAAELVRARADAIVAATTPAIRAAHRATNVIPIVMATVGDPIEEGFVASFARPGGNITGITTQAPELMAKRVQLFKEAVPSVKAMAVLLDSRNRHEIHGFREATAAALTLSVSLRPFEVPSGAQIDAAFAAMAQENFDGLFVFESAITNAFRRRIVELATRHRIPGIYPFREFAESGGLMSFGANVLQNYRQAADYVDKILKGARAADLPVEQPASFELVINRKTANALGVTIPGPLLARADQVIE